MYYAIYIVVLIITIALIKNSNECIRVVQFSYKHIYQQILIGLTLAFILIFTLGIINLVWFHSFSVFQFMKLGVFARVNFFAFQLLVAVTEELLFRGYLLCIFKRITKSAMGAILLTAVLFAGIHFAFNQYFAQFVVALIIGFVFAIVLVKTGNCSIYSLILAHLLYDWRDIIEVQRANTPNVIESKKE